MKPSIDHRGFAISSCDCGDSQTTLAAEVGKVLEATWSGLHRKNGDTIHIGWEVVDEARQVDTTHVAVHADAIVEIGAAGVYVRL